MKTSEQILTLLVLVLSLSNLYFIYVYKLQIFTNTPVESKNTTLVLTGDELSREYSEVLDGLSVIESEESAEE